MAAKVAVLVGSLRKEAFSRKIAKALEKAAAGKLEFKFVEIGDLPFYNEDLEGDAAPAPWKRFRDETRGVDAFLFVTPEYNRSVPAAIKNAVDVGSRPFTQMVWTNKPAAIVSGSMGPIGGFSASHHLRQSLSVIGVHVLAQPEMYLGAWHNFLDENGDVKDDGAKKLVSRFVDSFDAWIKRFS